MLIPNDMAGFSWKAFKEEAIKLKIERAITMVSGDTPNTDMAIAHPDWVRQAQTKNFTDLRAKVRLQMEKDQARAQARRDKLVRKT